MKARDLRDRSTEDLAELERSLANERFQGKFKNFTNRLDDTSVIRKNKRDLARVKLILTERARGIVVVSKPIDAEQKPKTRAPKPAPADEAEKAPTTGEASEKTAKTPKAKKKAEVKAPKKAKAVAAPKAAAKAPAPKAPAAAKSGGKKPAAKKSGKGD
jgi:large subunit ribosomal protein L29